MPGERSTDPNIAVIGGGTGSVTLVSELKNFTDNISSIINMSDSGGSSGELRDEMGVLPPGDFLKALLALHNSPDFRRWFNSRFDESEFEGKLAGHSLGNIVIAKGQKEFRTFGRVSEAANNVFATSGQVIPVTLDKHDLVLKTKDGEIIGEHKIADATITDREARISHDPTVEISRLARRAIKNADIVVLAPGNVYCSLLASLALKGMREAMTERTGKLVAVTNLVTKPNHTTGWHVVDYVKKYEEYLGEGAVDVVLYNNAPPSDELLEKYAADGEYPVGFSPKRFGEVSARSIGDNFVSGTIYEQNPNDRIQRTLIRHDGARVGRHLMRLYYE